LFREARLLSRICDFEAMDEEAGQDKDRDGKTEQAEDGNKGRDRLGHDSEYRHGTFDGKIHRAEMLQIESDA
jgi:hypothetical protein